MNPAELRPCDLVCRRGGRLHPRKADEKETPRVVDGRVRWGWSGRPGGQGARTVMACQPQSMLTTLGPGAILGLKSPISFRRTFASLQRICEANADGIIEHLLGTMWRPLRSARLRRQGPQAHRERERGGDRSDDLRASRSRGLGTRAGARTRALMRSSRPRASPASVASRSTKTISSGCSTIGSTSARRRTRAWRIRIPASTRRSSTRRSGTGSIRVRRV